MNEQIKKTPEENIFKKPIHIFRANEKNPHEDSWQLGDVYFRAVAEARFRELTAEETAAFLNDFAAKQNEDGLLHLFDCDDMPGDAICGIWYQPSYAVAAVGVYAKVKYPQIFDDRLNTAFKKLLDTAFDHGIVAHGFDHPKAVETVMTGLGKAGCKQFFETHASFSEPFFQTVNGYVEEFKKISGSGRVYYDFGYMPRPISGQAGHMLAVWNGLERTVFVYGTLMHDQPAARFMNGAVYAGKYLLDGHALYNLGSYPTASPCPGESVIGEVYFTDDAKMEELDRYEGLGSLYERKTVTLRGVRGLYHDSETLEAEMYTYLGSTDGLQKLCEPWNASDSDPVWYAAYGSNLSEKRFAYYLLGGICEENGKRYTGCSEKTLWRGEAQSTTFYGRVYFGNSSPSWNGKGVAFFVSDPAMQVEMRLYKITRRQLREIWQQEGNCAGWYDRLLCLGLHTDRCPIYTITASRERPLNPPDEAYAELMRRALIRYCGYTPVKAERYVKKLIAPEKKRKQPQS